MISARELRREIEFGHRSKGTHRIPPGVYRHTIAPTCLPYPSREEKGYVRESREEMLDQPGRYLQNTIVTAKK